MTLPMFFDWPAKMTTSGGPVPDLEASHPEPSNQRVHDCGLSAAEHHP